MVDCREDSVTIRGREHELTLAGVTPVPALGTRLRAGDPLADTAAGHWVELSVRPNGAPPAPQLASAELSKGWLALSRDPRQVLGLPALPVSNRPMRCWRGATEALRGCRSTTTPGHPRSNAAGGTS